MTLNPRIVLVCATCIIISGFVGSFKSFQVYKDQIIDSQIVKSQSVGEFAGQNIEQKLMQLESAVSYLDNSTVETLKRFGVRYFAYAYKKNDEWSIKWKVLGEMGKKAILAEVHPLPFSDFDQKKRHWARSKDDQLIYISPVAMAKSFQLKEGFVVFGIKPDFFSSLKGAQDKYILLDSQENEIFGSLPSTIANKKEFFAEGGSSPRQAQVETDEKIEIVTASFLQRSQMWILRQESMAAVNFTGSRFFTYFLLTSGLGLLILLLMLWGRKSEAPVIARDRKKIAVAPAFAGIKNFFTSYFVKQKDAETSEQPIAEEEDVTIQVEEVEFADFLDRIVAGEMPRLEKVGVSIKALVEEEALVVCSPQRISDFLKRLIGNSVLSLENEEEKEIQIQMVEQADSYQLIYVDTRTDHFPSKEPSSLMAQTEGSLQGIDGIIAYAGWLFEDRLTVAKKGFCLSIDLPKAESPTGATTRPTTTEETIQPLQTIPMEDTLDRIEIDESEADMDLFSGFDTIASAEKMEEASTDAEIGSVPVDDATEPRVNFDDVTDQFRMKDFSFSADPKKLREEDETSVVEPVEIEEPTDEVELKQDDKGLYEFSSGQFKIKIRSPKKRESDVDR